MALYEGIKSYRICRNNFKNNKFNHGRSTHNCINDKHKRKQLPLTPPALPQFFRHLNLKVDTRTLLFFRLFKQDVYRR